ncbi:MAG: hypothetical protein FJW23_06850 [Acidimicrobiia bacterium]|nr:hypothetical protein [Acidimicrobiia bacterium]
MRSAGLKQVLALVAFVSLVAAPKATADTITFEWIPEGLGEGLPYEGLDISTQFQSIFGVYFTLDGAPTEYAKIVERGGYVTGDRLGFQYEDGVEAEGTRWDTPAPLQGVGNYFITNKQDFFDVPAGFLRANYITPVQFASANILDVDFGERWRVEALDSLDSVIDSVLVWDEDTYGVNSDLRVGGPSCYGCATPFSFIRPTADIYAIRFIPLTPSDEIGTYGVAFDNFSPSSLASGTVFPFDEAPPQVPEPVTLFTSLTGLGYLAARRRMARNAKKTDN